MKIKILTFVFGSMILASSFFILPKLSFAAGLVPSCNTKVDTVNGGFTDPCNFDRLIDLVNNVINFILIDLVTPIFALIMVYVGYLYLSDMGSAENKGKAKKILIKSVAGFVIALAAWLVIKTILTTLGFIGPMLLA